MRHLWGKCPSLTREDRVRVLAHRKVLPQLPSDFAAANAASQDSSNGSLPDHGPEQAPTKHDADQVQDQVESIAQREPSALDTLAEVSRQHLDLSRQRHINDMTSHGEEMSNDDGLYAQLRQSLAEDAEEQRAGIGDTAHDPLMQTASAANDLQEQVSREARIADDNMLAALAQLGHRQTYIDPQLRRDGDDASGLDAQAGTAVNLIGDGQAPFGDHGQAAYQSPASSGGFGLLGRPMQKKKPGRSRFTEERKKEVSAIRQLGSCIRCRMLKKKCSDGDPCEECRLVNAARLWKVGCVRAKLAMQFSLYKESLFHALSQHTISHAIGIKMRQIVPGRIEATLLPATGIYATFHAMIIKPAHNESLGIDPSLDAVPDNDNDRSGTFMLDFESDDITGKLERYLVDNTNALIALESSTFLRETLGRATALIGEQGDVLLAKVINLWIASNVLVYPQRPPWAISYVHDRTASLEPQYVPQEARDPATPVRHLGFDSQDHEIITGQLLDAIERYCAGQGKDVLQG